jgi:hypothetical protein
MKAKGMKQQGDTQTGPADRAHSLAHDSRIPTESTPSTDPDLTRIMAAWPALPPAIRRAMLALVEQ